MNPTITKAQDIISDINEGFVDLINNELTEYRH